VSREQPTEHKHRVLSTKEEYTYIFSVCCLVTRWEDYEAMRSAFELQGFDTANSEFLVCDNSSGNNFDAYEAIRKFLKEARGRYVVIVHQDAYPLEQSSKLMRQLVKLEKIDPKWGVVGNAGVNRRIWLRLVGALQMPEGAEISMDLPSAKVDAVDENVLIIRNGSGVTVSSDLRGFHFYGFDICSVAARLGMSSYVIDYRWYHGSYGTIEGDFFSAKGALQAKLKEYFSITDSPTTCSYLNWSRSPFRKALVDARSFCQVALSKRHKEARRYTLKEGLKNPFFVPALLGLILFYGPRAIFRRIQRALKARNLSG